MCDDHLRADLRSRHFEEELRVRGLTIVPGALPSAEAEDVARVLRDQPDDAWSITVHKGAPATPQRCPNTAMNRSALRDDIDVAREAFLAGKFSYYFMRCNAEHAGNCTCALCTLPAMLQTCLTGILGKGYRIPVGEIASHFCSWYPPGSFLGPHSDKGNGRVGFVLSLTRRWLPQWGGILHFDMGRASGPSFWASSDYNSLLVFEVDRFLQFPHFVSPVSDRATEKRIAVTGWFT